MSVTPVHSFHTFSQTAAMQTLSIHKAERDIPNKRNNLQDSDAQESDGEQAELAAKKVANNRERVRGGGPSHPPQNNGSENLRLLERLEETEANNQDDNNMADMEY